MTQSAIRLLAAGGRAVASLPAQPGRMIDRDDELRDLCHLVREPDVRMVTLTGPGGSGKTRLAIAAADEVADAFGFGVCFVDLSALREPDQVLPSIVDALGLRERQDQSALDALREHLKHAELLLLLDNFEQVLPAPPRWQHCSRRAPG